MNQTRNAPLDAAPSSPESQPKVYRHQFRAERLPPPISSKICSSCLIALTSRNGAQGGIRTLDLPSTRRMLGVDLDGSRRIEPAHVGWPVGPDGSRRIQTDPDGSRRIQTDPDGSRRIVWMSI